MEKISDNTFVVKVRQLPEHGEANAAIVETLAKYLDIPKTSLRIISGQASKTKLLEF